MDKMNMFLNASPRIFYCAKLLRESPTKAEKILWTRLSRNQLGVRFRRQHPILMYVADFYCHARKLVVELDGEIHDTQENAFSDYLRTDHLSRFGINVIRFRNDEVEASLDSVVTAIKRELVRLANS